MVKTKPLILLLIMAIAAASIFCCCFQDEAMASAKVPECHQTAQADSEQNTNDCECDNIISLQAKKFSFNFESNSSKLFLYLEQPVHFLSAGEISYKDFIILLSSLSNKSLDSPQPLYIQHSNLRL